MPLKLLHIIIEYAKDNLSYQKVLMTRLQNFLTLDAILGSYFFNFDLIIKHNI